MSKAATQARQTSVPVLTVPSYPVPNAAGQLMHVQPIVSGEQVTLSPVPPMLMRESEVTPPPPEEPTV